MAETSIAGLHLSEAARHADSADAGFHDTSIEDKHMRR